jgi:hypothetical protein
LLSKEIIMQMITKELPQKHRGKWDFIPNMPPETCLIFETEDEANNCRRAIYWHGFKAISRKTRQGWMVWKAPK